MLRTLIAALAFTLRAMPALASANASHMAHTVPHAHSEAELVGQPGSPDKAQRTVTVTLGDTMRFDPSIIQVKAHETVRFELKNTGKVRHEFVFGTERELKEHAAMMREMPDMVHTDPNSVVVEPGATKTLVWQFGHPGVLAVGCLQAGHYEAGMKGAIRVTP